MARPVELSAAERQALARRISRLRSDRARELAARNPPETDSWSRLSNDIYLRIGSRISSQTLNNAERGMAGKDVAEKIAAYLGETMEAWLTEKPRRSHTPPARSYTPPTGFTPPKGIALGPKHTWVDEGSPTESEIRYVEYEERDPVVALTFARAKGFTRKGILVDEHIFDAVRLRLGERKANEPRTEREVLDAIISEIDARARVRDEILSDPVAELDGGRKVTKR